MPILDGDAAKPFQTGEEWLKQQPKDVQDSVLGNEAGKAWRADRVTLADFIGVDKGPVWGTTRYTLSLKDALAAAVRRTPTPAPSPAPAPAPKPKPAPTPKPPPAPKPPKPPKPTPVKKGMPGQPQTIVGVSAPVSDALYIGARGQVGAAIRHAVAAVDAVHTDGELPIIPISADSSTRQNGVFRYFNPLRSGGDCTASEIQISRLGPTYDLTAVHEVGHFIDQQLLGKRLRFASGDLADAALADWRAAVDMSVLIADLKAIKKARTIDVEISYGQTVAVPLTYKQQEHVDYLLLRHEVWARSYAQYIAVRSGDATLLQQLDQKRVKSIGFLSFPTQWSDADFEPVAAAIDKLLQSKGLMPTP